MSLLYFAYGSNMSSARLLSRVTSACVIGICTLPGARLMFHKRSVDGSAKCDALFTGESGDVMHGVLYRIAADHRAALDRVEGLGSGYAQSEVEVSLAYGRSERAFTYVATAIDDSLKPYAWYRHHVISGALEHGLPEHYLAMIRAVEVMDDADVERASREMAIYCN